MQLAVSKSISFPDQKCGSTITGREKIVVKKRVRKFVNFLHGVFLYDSVVKVQLSQSRKASEICSFLIPHS